MMTDTWNSAIIGFWRKDMNDLRELYEHLIKTSSQATVKDIIMEEIEYNYPYVKKEDLNYIEVICVSIDKLDGINISFNAIIDGKIRNFTYINNESSLDIKMEGKRITQLGEIQNFPFI